ncbi:hypothetical protein GCM10028795_18010 [Lysobacter olei]
MTRNSTRSSNGFASCHLEWGPSRQLALMLLLLGGLAVVALLASDLPRGWAWLGAPLALAYAAWLARCELRKPWRTLQVPGLPPVRQGEEAGPLEPPTLDGHPLIALEVRWRGAAAFLRCRGQDGRPFRTVLWPDVTQGASRRELRLALRDRETSPSRPSVAP